MICLKNKLSFLIIRGIINNGVVVVFFSKSSVRIFLVHLNQMVGRKLQLDRRRKTESGLGDLGHAVFVHLFLCQLI